MIGLNAVLGNRISVAPHLVSELDCELEWSHVNRTCTALCFRQNSSFFNRSLLSVVDGVIRLL